MSASSQSSASSEVWSVRHAGIKLRFCTKGHIIQHYLLVGVQKRDKRFRDQLNRNPGARHNRLMSVVNRLIRDRRFVLAMPASFGWCPIGWCPIFDAIKMVGYNAFEEGLSSSRVEHLIRNQEVLGSIPGRGSNTSNVERETTHEATLPAEAKPCSSD